MFHVKHWCKGDNMQFEPNGIVKLCKVPWNSDYRDTRYFSNKEEQSRYFIDLPGITYEDCSYTKATIPFVAVEANIEDIYHYNYLIYQNRTHGNKWFYAFIDRLEMRAAETTWVYFSIDVIQTWFFEALPTQCFVVREHPGIQSDKLNQYSMEEGIGFGTEYDILSTQLRGMADRNNMVALVISTIKLEEKAGTADNPNIVPADSGEINGIPTTCGYYVVNEEYGSGMKEFTESLEKIPWYSNSILSVTMIPKYMIEGCTIKRVAVGSGPYGGSDSEIGKIIASPPQPPEHLENFDFYEYVSSARPTSQKKLYTYPYTVIEISLLNGNTLLVKPQHLTSSHYLGLQRWISIGGGSPEIRYTVSNYRPGDGLDFSLKVNDFPLCPVHNNNYLTALAQMESRYNMQIDHNADAFLWSSINSVLGGAASQYALSGRQVTENLNNPGNDYTPPRSSRVTYPDPDRGLYMGVNSVGKAAGMLGNFNSAQNSIEALQLNFGQAHAQTPTLQTCAGGSSFNIVHNQFGVNIRIKQIDKVHFDALESYFNRYGYKVGKIKVPDITNMSRFNYIQTVNAHVAGSIANDDRVLIERIYDTGITFWHDDNIGNYDNNVGVR